MQTAFSITRVYASMAFPLLTHPVELLQSITRLVSLDPGCAGKGISQLREHDFESETISTTEGFLLQHKNTRRDTPDRFWQEPPS
jgi:hypothetical protein